MSAKTVQLYQFAFSHFCEKARWALEYSGFECRPVNLVPVLHVVRVRAMARNSTVPLIKTPAPHSEMIQGSSAIIDWAVQASPAGERLNPDGWPAEDVRAFEERFDRLIGSALQTLLYEILLNEREHLLALWSDAAGGAERLMLRAALEPGLLVLRSMYRINPRGCARARASLEEALTELDQIYSRQQYIDGHAFSRLDLSVAALLSPLFDAEEHPAAGLFKRLGRAAGHEQLNSSFKDRPAVRHCLELYRRFRA